MAGRKVVAMVAQIVDWKGVMMVVLLAAEMVDYMVEVMDDKTAHWMVVQKVVMWVENLACRMADRKVGKLD